MTRDEFTQPMALLSASLARTIERPTLEAWFLILGDLTAEQLTAGIVRTLRTYEFAGLPSPAVIRRNAGVNSSFAVEDRSAVAWATIKRAVARVGGYHSIDFDDPLITATIRALGGWERICDTEAGEQFDVWLRRDFERLYASLQRTGIDAQETQPLPGLIDVANSATGHDDRSPVKHVRTGLPAPTVAIRGTLPAPAPKPAPFTPTVASVAAATVSQGFGDLLDLAPKPVRENTPLDVQIAGLKRLMQQKDPA